jgi:hypothetical protein
MGIGLSGQSWFTVVAKTRAEEVERIKKGFEPRLAVQTYANPENIKSTPAADALILSRCTPFDEEGLALPSTERGKRRRAKRQHGG